MENRKQQSGLDVDRSLEDAKDRPNQIAYVESWHGPEQQYCCTAYVTRYPTPKGLEGGHLLEFSIARENPRWESHAPDMDDPGYEAWVQNNPREIPVAGYKDGALARHSPDVALNAVIEQIKQTYSSERIKQLGDNLEWHHHEPRSRDTPSELVANEDKTFVHALIKAARHEADRTPDKERDQSKDIER